MQDGSAGGHGFRWESRRRPAAAPTPAAARQPAEVGSPRGPSQPLPVGLSHRHRNVAEVDMPRWTFVEIIHAVAARFHGIGEGL